MPPALAPLLPSPRAADSSRALRARRDVLCEWGGGCPGGPTGGAGSAPASVASGLGDGEPSARRAETGEGIQTSETAVSDRGDALATSLGSCAEAAPRSGGSKRDPVSPRHFLPLAPLRRGLGRRGQTPNVFLLGALLTSLRSSVSGSVPRVTRLGLLGIQWGTASSPTTTRGLHGVAQRSPPEHGQ